MNILGVFIEKRQDKTKQNFEQTNNQKRKTKLNKGHFEGFDNSEYFFMS